MPFHRFDPDGIARRLSRRALVIILSLTLGAAAAVVAYFSGDLWVTRSLQRLHNPYFHWLMVAVSWPGYFYRQLVVALCAAALLLLLRQRIEAVCMIMGLVSSWLLVNVIK